MRQLDRQHVGIFDLDYQVAGIRLYSDVHPSRLFYMLNRRVTFDMGAWIQDPSPHVFLCKFISFAEKIDRFLLIFFFSAIEDTVLIDIMK